MVNHAHPQSSLPIRGMRLGHGARLRETDHYAASDGRWRPAGSWAGAMLVLRRECPTVWIRPDAELSAEARSLLAHLAASNFYLTQRGARWIIIPSPKWKYDGRMDWPVRHTECVQELIDYGFVESSPVDVSLLDLDWGSAWPQPDDLIWGLSEAGRIAVGS